MIRHLKIVERLLSCNYGVGVFHKDVHYIPNFRLNKSNIDVPRDTRKREYRMIPKKGHEKERQYVKKKRDFQ